MVVGGTHGPSTCDVFTVLLYNIAQFSFVVFIAECKSFMLHAPLFEANFEIVCEPYSIATLTYFSMRVILFRLIQHNLTLVLLL